MTTQFRCWKTSGSKFVKLYDVRNNCGNSGGENSFGNTNLWHRGCCHSDKSNSEDYLSPMMKAINQQLEGKTKQAKSRVDTRSEIKKAYNTAKREETKFGESRFLRYTF